MGAVDHVMLGAGAVGMAVAEALAAREESVRVVSRSDLREPVAGVQSVAGDVTDPAFAASATHGARVVYQALNPPCHRWAQDFPGLQAAAIAAAQTAGAHLVVMDNVYMHGRANGQRFTQDRAEQSLIGDWVIPPALADKPASVMGDPDLPHTYTFIPDIGENLVNLGERDDALGRVWHLPSPKTRTTRDVVALVYRGRAGGR
jgi:nucleoside-diphosphate-sugar epimerase